MLWTQHGDETPDDTKQARDDMHCHDTQKNGGSGWDWNSENHDAWVGHHGPFKGAVLMGEV